MIVEGKKKFVRKEKCNYFVIVFVRCNNSGLLFHQDRNINIENVKFNKNTQSTWNTIILKKKKFRELKKKHTKNLSLCITSLMLENKLIK